MPLKAMCSKKRAAPLLESVSWRLPASIHTPTVAVAAKLVSADATGIRLSRDVTCDPHCRLSLCSTRLIAKASRHASRNVCDRRQENAERSCACPPAKLAISVCSCGCMGTSSRFTCHVWRVPSLRLVELLCPQEIWGFKSSIIWAIFSRYR